MLVQIQQQFWKIYNREYLHLLQERVKWKMVKNNIQVGDMVLLFDENSPSTHWLLGGVSECHTGQDLVRVVTINTKSGFFKRSINKICKLPIE
jgi:hypothetical protein